MASKDELLNQAAQQQAQAFQANQANQANQATQAQALNYQNIVKNHAVVQQGSPAPGYVAPRTAWGHPMDLPQQPAQPRPLPAGPNAPRRPRPKRF